MSVTCQLYSLAALPQEKGSMTHNRRFDGHQSQSEHYEVEKAPDAQPLKCGYTDTVMPISSKSIVKQYLHWSSALEWTRDCERIWRHSVHNTFKIVLNFYFPTPCNKLISTHINTSKLNVQNYSIKLFNLMSHCGHESRNQTDKSI
jgi:hypothetical protein